ncbi:MAG TPA: hypothetical protein VK824_06790 [Planctomycetota bacterium]|nr:hypothetical protein [Planctomycetota bacterium]
MYEHSHQTPLTPRQFAWRFTRHVAASQAVVAVSLGAGMLGYEHFEGLAWRDAFLNAAMLLGGMGPVDAPHSPNGKLFAGFYALYAGLVFLIVTGILLAPLVHRIMHHMHVDEGTE